VANQIETAPPPQHKPIGSLRVTGRSVRSTHARQGAGLGARLIMVLFCFALSSSAPSRSAASSSLGAARQNQTTNDVTTAPSSQPLGPHAPQLSSCKPTFPRC